MKELEDFQAFYESELQELIGAVEESRKGMIRWALILGVIAFVLPALIYYASTITEYVPVWFALICVPLIPVLFGFAYKALFWNSGIKDEYFQAVYAPIVGFVSNKLQAADDRFGPRYIDYNFFSQSKLFYFQAQHYIGHGLFVEPENEQLMKMFPDQKGKTAQLSWVEAYFDTGEEENPTLNKLFSGLFAYGSLMQSVSADIIILSSPIQRNYGYLGRKIQSSNPIRGEFVDIEHEDFPEYYVVYADDPNNARESLTDDFMDALVKFYDESELEISIRLRGKEIFFAIHDIEEAFSISLLRGGEMEDACEKLFLAINLTQNLANKLIDPKMLGGSFGGGMLGGSPGLAGGFGNSNFGGSDFGKESFGELDKLDQLEKEQVKSEQAPIDENILDAIKTQGDIDELLDGAGFGGDDMLGDFDFDDDDD